MKSTSIIFGVVMVIPLIIAVYYILLKDKQKKGLGMIVVGVTFIIAIILSYYVNRNK